MSGRGVHFALSSAELEQLRLMSDAQACAHYVSNDIETEKFGSDDACETDKSWAYIHSALTGMDPDGDLGMFEVKPPKPRGLFARLFGGKASTVDASKFAESDAITGTSVLACSDDYYIGLVPAERVPAVSAALSSISLDDLGQRVIEAHKRHDASGEASEAADYAKGWYPDLVFFYRRAAGANKHVIFTVDF